MFESKEVKKLEGKFYGAHRATVLKNNDPLTLGRVKVECPSVYGEGIESPWCYSVSPLASDGYGIFAIPQKGNYVWILFEKGDPNKPLWLGSPFTNSVPEKFAKTEIGNERSKPNCFGMMTPSGSYIIFDDDPINNNITIEHKTGAMIKIDKDGNISLTPAGTKKINLMSDVYVDGILTINSNVNATGNISGATITDRSI